MTAAIGILGLDAAKWRRISPAQLLPAAMLAVGASGALALSRFGGAAIDEPRAFVRLTLIGVWGWIGLAATLWLVALVLRLVPAGLDGLLRTLSVVGTAHGPVLAFGFVILGSAGVFDVLGPGLVAAYAVFALWLPAQLTIGLRAVTGARLVGAVAVVAVPYGLWLATVGRHLLGQVQHML